MAVSIHVHENLIMLYLYNQIEKGKYKFWQLNDNKLVWI